MNIDKIDVDLSLIPKEEQVEEKLKQIWSNVALRNSYFEYLCKICIEEAEKRAEKLRNAPSVKTIRYEVLNGTTNDRL